MFNDDADTESNTYWRTLALHDARPICTDLSAQERCRVIVEREILGHGYTIYGWRQVPVNVDIIGEMANATRPEIEQISSEEHTSDLQSLMRNSYAVLCLNTKNRLK